MYEWEWLQGEKRHNLFDRNEFSAFECMFVQREVIVLSSRVKLLSSKTDVDLGCWSFSCYTVGMNLFIQAKVIFNEKDKMLG